jgi:mono/diheme cytochrome c family protein
MNHLSRGAVVVGALLMACAAPAPREVNDAAFARFLNDRETRRAALEASLPTSSPSAYVARRLAHYATTDARSWEALPEWNPPTRMLRDDDEAEGPLAISAAARAGDRAALIELGRQAFVRYPAQRAPFDVDKLAENDVPPQLVRVRYASGASATAMTCATCHSGRDDDGRTTIGVANDDLDLGALMAQAPLGRVHPSPAHDDAITALLAWGPGRVDVTTAAGTEPAHIPDLRAVRFQLRLQHAGIVEQRDVTSLAVRLETLIVTGHDEVVRPPREVALGLALYLWSLGDALPVVDTQSAGARVFQRACGRCHAGEGMAGGLVDVDVLGTDATLARSNERGTGGYRTTSLRGVGSRRRLLHDGSVGSLEALLDPQRRGGHRYGLELRAEQRAALVAWLTALR